MKSTTIWQRSGALAAKQKRLEKLKLRNLMVERVDGLVKITLQSGKVVTIDEDDFGMASGRYWYVNNHGYVCTRDAPQLHRMIMGAKKGEIVDHRNGDPLDNRKCNLRLCNAHQSSCNRRIQKNNTSGFKGVSLKKNTGKYDATIRVHGKDNYLGTFDNKVEAAKAYNKAAHRFHGEFASLNQL